MMYHGTEKEKEYKRKWAKSKSGKLSKQKYRKSLKGKAADRRKDIKIRYKISMDDYNNLLEKQNGKCAICLKSPPISNRRLSVDHDHNCCQGNRSCGKCIRGLLCHRCNTAIGLLDESVPVLKAAINYLENNSTHISACGVNG